MSGVLKTKLFRYFKLFRLFRLLMCTSKAQNIQNVKWKKSKTFGIFSELLLFYQFNVINIGRLLKLDLKRQISSGKPLVYSQEGKIAKN